MRRRTIRGFTLLEVIVTVTILGILASAAFPVARIVSQRAKESELRLALRQIRNGIDAYKQAVDEGRVAKTVDESGYPHTLDDLVQGAKDQTSSDKALIFFLRRLPRDPMNPDSTLSAAETWGLRSYNSPLDDPQSGEDVFDVYSLSEKIGLNRIPYREW
ncbi:type II secretion system protein [Uliginosibacterium sp. 31-16]|uniref:type II secretion system protein n=1 Tax=Uliginosibacterium sp. 31-16 TaxID=3068315 RepID=UPI00273FC635|nr:type II secretion system protein [Uliginosibacterium sp. 31-16]MDP5241113.1 type II secretion system protein [Uliginosibacterium sp. 31-16]